MASKKHSEQLKLEIVLEYLSDRLTYREVGKKYSVDESSVRGWVAAYNEHGISGLNTTHRTYSGEFKLSVIKYMHNTGCSARQTAAHFSLPTHQIVGKWERIYNEKGAAALFVGREGRSENMSKSKTKKPEIKKHEDEDLIAEVQRLRMENEYLKKLNALVQAREKSAKRTK